MADVPTASGGNSTSSPLGSAETFTGPWEVNNHEHVLVNVLADQEGTLHFDFGVKNSDGDSAGTFSSAVSATYHGEVSA